MNTCIDKVILTDIQIKRIVNRISKKINKYYYNSKEIIEIIVILEGAKIFSNDIFASSFLETSKFNINFINISSYHNGTKSKDKINIEKCNLSHIEKKKVLIIDDIYETGNTLDFLIKYLKKYNPLEIKICVLLERDIEHKKKIDIEFLGVIVRNLDFLVGYGLDYQGKCRELPLIGTLKK